MQREDYIMLSKAYESIVYYKLNEGLYHAL